MDDNTGFVKTSFINRKENPLMSDLIWITDTCHNMELVKNYQPEKSVDVFNKMTDFYAAQQHKFDETIEKPFMYKQNGFWPQETKYGDVFNNKKELIELLKSGEERIISQPDVETLRGFYSKNVKPWEEKCLSRDFDAAMSFMLQTEKLNLTNVQKDASKRLLILT